MSTKKHTITAGPAFHHAPGPRFRLKRPGPNGEKWACPIEVREVRVMVVTQGYAMIRRKGSMPYCCPVKELIQ